MNIYDKIEKILTKYVKDDMFKKDRVLKLILWTVNVDSCVCRRLQTIRKIA